jgi:hypothetical protein
MAPFPQAPLKFRTAGFPQYGFKLACPTVTASSGDAVAGLPPAAAPSSANSVSWRGPARPGRPTFPSPAERP